MNLNDLRTQRGEGEISKEGREKIAVTMGEGSRVEKEPNRPVTEELPNRK